MHRINGTNGWNLLAPHSLGPVESGLILMATSAIHHAERDGYYRALVEFFGSRFRLVSFRPKANHRSPAYDLLTAT
jgi:hypothetical protein